MQDRITAHMIVKNEDQWVYYAITSVLPFVETMLITDTGSTDKTVAVIKSIKSKKIIFDQVICTSPKDVTQVRQSQLKKTKTPWFWIVDGDEVYTHALAKEVLEAVDTKRYDIICVRRHDLLGDIYHAQDETVGTYNLYGYQGHLLTRLFNLKSLKGLTLKGDYPNEGYYIGKTSTLDLSPSKVYVTKDRLFHAMYLGRSSLGQNLSMFNRNKYKIELGKSVVDPYPEVFDSPSPGCISDPRASFSLSYQILASIITPIKRIYRKLKK